MNREQPPYSKASTLCETGNSHSKAGARSYYRKKNMFPAMDYSRSLEEELLRAGL